MKLLLKLGWRNIWRNKRRSLLTLLAIAFATLSAIAMRGVQLGTYAVNIENAVQMFTGYIQIQAEGYQQNPSLNKNFKFDKEIENALNSIPEIKSYSRRVYADGLISYKENSQGAAILGVDPEAEKQTTKLLERVEAGSFFTSDTSNKIVLGYKLLENLKAEIGDEIVILSQGYDGSMGNLKFKIVGTVKFGSPEIDNMGAFIGLSTAQQLLAMYGGRIHAVAINLDELQEIPNVKHKLVQKINDSSIAVLSWDEVMPDFKESIEFDNISGIFYLAILIVIVAFGILNTVLMSVTERFNEFGVTLSIGMPQMKLVYLILLETLFLTLLGIFIGNIIGWGINYYIIQNPIEFGKELGMMYEEYGFLPIMKSSLKPSIFFNTSISVLVISILSAFYPAYKVFKLEPLKGIRYT